MPPMRPLTGRMSVDSLIRQQGNAEFARQVLEHLSFDMVKWDDDFLGDTLHGGYQTSTSGAGAAALAITAPTAAARNGTATMVTGTSDNGYSGMSLGLHYYGEHFAIAAAIISVSAITSVKMEFGWTDVTAGTDAGAVNALDTPTFNADDAAVWVFDTDSSSTSWQAAGVAATVAATKIQPTVIGNFDGDAAPNADIRELLIVMLQDGSARFMRGDMNDKALATETDLSDEVRITYDSGWSSGFITSTVALTPWLFVQARAGSASRTLTVDRFMAWQRRNNS